MVTGLMSHAEGMADMNSEDKEKEKRMKALADSVTYPLKVASHKERFGCIWSAFGHFQFYILHSLNSTADYHLH